jgi:hypothetical protein
MTPAVTIAAVLDRVVDSLVYSTSAFTEHTTVFMVSH